MTPLAEALPVVVPIVGYVLLIRYARPSPKLRALQTAHNSGLALFSLWVVARVGRNLTIDRRTTWGALLCQTPVFDGVLWRLWYVSKLWEWFDTLLLIAADRPLHPLHVNHHASTAALVALQTYKRASYTPLADVGTLLNAAIHVAMYVYYIWPRFLRPFKRLITCAQIAQHAFMVVAIAIVLVTRTDSEQCDVPSMHYGVTLAIYLMYFVQFVVFYRATYEPSIAVAPTRDKTL